MDAIKFVFIAAVAGGVLVTGQLSGPPDFNSIGFETEPSSISFTIPGQVPIKIELEQRTTINDPVSFFGVVQDNVTNIDSNNNAIDPISTNNNSFVSQDDALILTQFQDPFPPKEVIKSSQGPLLQNQFQDPFPPTEVIKSSQGPLLKNQFQDPFPPTEVIKSSQGPLLQNQFQDPFPPTEVIKTSQGTILQDSTNFNNIQPVNPFKNPAFPESVHPESNSQNPPSLDLIEREPLIMSPLLSDIIQLESNSQNRTSLDFNEREPVFKFPFLPDTIQPESNSQNSPSPSLNLIEQDPILISPLVPERIKPVFSRQTNQKSQNQNSIITPIENPENIMKPTMDILQTKSNQEPSLSPITPATQELKTTVEDEQHHLAYQRVMNDWIRVASNNLKRPDLLNLINPVPNNNLNIPASDATKQQSIMSSTFLPKDSLKSEVNSFTLNTIHQNDGNNKVTSEKPYYKKVKSTQKTENVPKSTETIPIKSNIISRTRFLDIKQAELVPINVFSNPSAPSGFFYSIGYSPTSRFSVFRTFPR